MATDLTDVEICAVNTADVFWVDPDFLIPASPDSHCTSHSNLLAKFAGYNAVAVILSLLLASPLIYVRISHLKSKFFTQDRNLPEGHHSTFSIILSGAGSAALLYIANTLAGVIIALNTYNSGGLLTGFELYSFRPRATCLIFPLCVTLHYCSAPTSSIRGSKNGFLVAGVTSLVADAAVGCSGFYVLAVQACGVCSIPWRTCGHPVDLRVFNAMRHYAIGLIASNATLVAALFVLLGCAACRKHQSGTDLTKLTGYLWLPWILTLITYIISWRFWIVFLHGSTERQYCVEDVHYIDAVFYSLPVAMGLWTHGVTAS